MTIAEPNGVEPSTSTQPVGVAIHSCPNLLQGVAHATNQLLTTEDLEQILQTTVTEVRQFLECDRVF
ncbi:MAG: hypothetical protein F6K28_37185 [Microcoleus sp. SIO2G3]|nr:hypothetical protein [Microcoleus sp. SIO2G3]